MHQLMNFYLSLQNGTTDSSSSTILLTAVRDIWFWHQLEIRILDFHQQIKYDTHLTVELIEISEIHICKNKTKSIQRFLIYQHTLISNCTYLSSGFTLACINKKKIKWNKIRFDALALSNVKWICDLALMEWKIQRKSAINSAIKNHRLKFKINLFTEL